MKEPFTGGGRALVVVSLVLTVVFSLVAFTTNHNAFIFAAMVFALVPLWATLAGGRDRPAAAGIKVFVEGAIRRRYGGDVFTVRSVKPGLFSILYGRRGYIPFRLDVSLNEPFFQTVAAPWDRLEGLTPRRLETMRKQVDSLVQLLGEEAAGLREEIPRDPFTTLYVVERWKKDARLGLSGAVTATPAGETWTYSLEYLNFGRKNIAAMGQPCSSFPGSVVVGTWGGERWITETVAAWQAFSRKLAGLQEQAEAARADQGDRAVRAFFRSVSAGMHFHGIGHSASAQHPPTDFFLEIRSTRSGDRRVGFVLRNDGDWAKARPFSCSVAFDVTEKTVWVHATTGRFEACADGGPLIGAPGAFALDFHFKAGPPVTLQTFGGDVSVCFEEVSRAVLRELRAHIHAQSRSASDQIEPGAAYEGRVTLGGDEKTFRLVFLESAAPGKRLEARLESPDSATVLSVVEPGEAAGADCGDLVLESPGRVDPEDGADGSGGDTWRRVVLTAVGAGFHAVIEGRGEPFPIEFARCAGAPGETEGNAGPHPAVTKPPSG